MAELCLLLSNLSLLFFLSMKFAAILKNFTRGQGQVFSNAVLLIFAPRLVARSTHARPLLVLDSALKVSTPTMAIATEVGPLIGETFEWPTCSSSS